MERGSLDDLATFVVIARLGSFTRAAAQIGTSVSNLSHTMRRLEGRIGTRLLRRNSRSVAPTEVGVDLLATLGPALESIEGALDALGQGRDRVSGTLRLTMTRQAYEAVVRPMLPAFAVAHPDATVEVLIDYAYRDIIADRFDAGIRLGEKVERDMIVRKVIIDQLCAHDRGCGDTSNPGRKLATGQPQEGASFADLAAADHSASPKSVSISASAKRNVKATAGSPSASARTISSRSASAMARARARSPLRSRGAF